MLRECADALEGLAAQRPVVLVLEDVHWSDGATLQALATVMQRQTPARLLVVGTYRPAELGGLDHPWRSLLQEWQGRGVSEDLEVPPLTVPEVAAYVASRLGGTVPEMLPALIYQRTEGHALFVTRVVEHLLQ
jgi:predicted ATPase